jgi:hypothetical protein
MWLYAIFFGELSVQIFWLYAISFLLFSFTCSRYIGYMASKYFLLAHSLHFHIMTVCFEKNELILVKSNFLIFVL